MKTLCERGAGPLTRGGRPRPPSSRMEILLQEQRVLQRAVRTKWRGAVGSVFNRGGTLTALPDPGSCSQSRLSMVRVRASRMPVW